MKRIRIIMGLALMAMVMPCPAQNNMGIQQPTKKQVTTSYMFYELPGVKSHCTPVTPAGYEKVTKNGVTTFVEGKELAAKRAKRKAVAAKEGTYAVKCIFDCDMAAWQPSHVQVYNKTTDKTEYYDWENNFVTFDLEPGTYDVFAVFAKIEPTSMFGTSIHAWVIKENVEVTSETTVTLDPNTATNHISMKSYNPNGEQTRVNRIKFIDENYNIETLEKGNVFDVYIDKIFVHEDYGSLYRESINLGALVEFNPDYPQYGEEDREELLGDFYVNDVSDKYMFQQFRMMMTDDETYSTVIRAKCGETQTVTNDYTKYYEDPIKFNYVNSPSNEKYAEVPEGGVNGVSYFCTINNCMPDIWSGLMADGKWLHTIYFCPPTTVTEYNNIMDFGFNFRYVDACYSQVYDFGDGYPFTVVNAIEVKSQNIFPQTDGNKYVYSDNTTWLTKPKSGDPLYGLPGAEGLNFDYSNTDLVAGATCPIAISYYYDSPQWWAGNSVLPSFDTYYIGQMGEWRGADGLDATLELKADDKVVATNADELDEWINSGEPHNPAKLMLSITSRNFKVDGIEGGNDVVCVVDQNKDDHFNPSLTALQFRGADGKVTNRFENAADATMAIMCGDFNQVIDQESEYKSFWFEYDDCDVTVECAPNGTEDFTAIEMTKDDSKFYVPGFGAYYSANLSAVTAESSNGWYDLRVTVKDEAGNYQQQTFGPAFYIGAVPSGITGVKTGNGVEVARYTIDGRAINAPQAGVNIVKMSDGTVKKVWVK